MRLAIRGLSALDLRSCSASEMEEEEDDRDDETLLTVLTLLSFAGGMAGTGAVPVVALVKLAMLQCPCSPETDQRKRTLFPFFLLLSFLAVSLVFFIFNALFNNMFGNHGDGVVG